MMTVPSHRMWGWTDQSHQLSVGTWAPQGGTGIPIHGHPGSLPPCWTPPSVLPSFPYVLRCNLGNKRISPWTYQYILLSPPWRFSVTTLRHEQPCVCSATPILLSIVWVCPGYQVSYILMICILQFLIAFELFQKYPQNLFFSFPIAYTVVRKPYDICSDTDLYPPSKLTVWLRWSDTSLFWGIQDHWVGTEAVVRAFCVNALAIDATVGVLTFIHIWKGKKSWKKTSHQLCLIHLPTLCPDSRGCHNFTHYIHITIQNSLTIKPWCWVLTGSKLGWLSG